MSKYRIIKKDKNGEIYEVDLNTDKELMSHLEACFCFKNHTVLAVINIEVYKRN